MYPLTSKFLVNGSKLAPQAGSRFWPVDKYFSCQRLNPAPSVGFSAHLLVRPCQMAKNRYSKLFFGPLTRKLLVKPRRMRKSCCKGFRRSPDAWKTLLALRRSSWQSSGPSCVQTLLRPRRRISHGRDGFGQETNLERTRFAWRVFRAVMASGALPKPGKRCFRRGGATGKPKRGGGRARQRNWMM